MTWLDPAIQIALFSVLTNSQSKIMFIPRGSNNTEYLQYLKNTPFKFSFYSSLLKQHELSPDILMHKDMALQVLH